MDIVLKLKRLDPEVAMPAYARAGDAGLDLYAAEAAALEPGDRRGIRTGVALEIPEGYVGLIWDKSGLSQSHGLKTLGGVVDAGFRGEVLVGLVNLSSAAYRIEKNHKIAQMVIQKKESVRVEEVAELSGSERGASGFGSTGK